jgi:hypothetical protein
MRFLVVTVLILSYFFSVGSGAAWVWSMRNDLNAASSIFLVSAVLFLSSWAYIKADNRFHLTACACKKEPVKEQEDVNA